ncbi:hypothetical protein LPY66_03845 [Dehalobacter sp. DCM]|uniref:hypothetical protein n=1 Tax=Dehalobacter sp. DCM TaxID=2907827 RepID=UPI0030819260|nr:hypothetical protein LPY66_03845 [Dehalobacter sp. DCM]
MKKFNDWFFAGIIAGLFGGIAHLLYNALLLAVGIQYKTFWHVMAGVFYGGKLTMMPSAQIHGMIDAIGLSVATGVLLSLTLFLTGKDYLYAKSITMSASGPYFVFLIIVSQGDKNSLIVPWVALFGYIVFNGILEGYLLNKICTYKTRIE